MKAISVVVPLALLGCAPDGAERKEKEKASAIAPSEPVVAPAIPKLADAAVALGGKSFNGEAVRGEAVRDKSARGEALALTFEEGKLRSPMFAKNGFDDLPYTVVHVEGTKVFVTATAKNADGDRIDWRGTIDDDRVDSSGFVTRASGAVEPLRFQTPSVR